jgi:hypothetical protein
MENVKTTPAEFVHALHSCYRPHCTGICAALRELRVREEITGDTYWAVTIWLSKHILDVLQKDPDHRYGRYVAMPYDWEFRTQMLDDIISRICKRYNVKHPGRLYNAADFELQRELDNMHW